MYSSKLKKCIFLLLLVFSFTVISGCGEQVLEIGNPTPKDFLDNPDADIFLWGDVVFLNAQDIDWVVEKEYSLGKYVGEITKTSTNPKKFEDGTSSKLPVGTKIYLVEGSESFQILIAVVNGVKIPYLAMLEG